MGNSPSVELPRRAPQKLSKPRVGNPSAAGLLTPNGYVNTSTSRRLSLVGFIRPLSYPLAPASSPNATTADLPGTAAQQEQQEQEPEPPHDPSPLVDDHSTAPSVSSDPPPEHAGGPRGRDSIFRSRSSYRRPQHRDRPARRHSSIGPPTSRTLGDRPSRANSMTFESSTVAFYGGQTAEKSVPSPLQSPCLGRFQLTLVPLQLAVCGLPHLLEL